MKRTKDNYILLSLITSCSFLAIHTFAFYPDESYDKSLDYLRLLTPGVLFSLFIIVIQRSIRRSWKLILLFFILLILYSVSILAGMSSWGIGVPFAGGIGAVVIWKLFYQNIELPGSLGRDYFVFGFIAGLAGVFLFYTLQYMLKDFWVTGVGFGFILAIWQLVFGTLWIKQNRTLHHRA
jgi:hypothetical protein